MLDERPPTPPSEPPGSNRPPGRPEPPADHPALGAPPPGSRLLRRNRERAYDRAWRGGRLATVVAATGRTLITVGLLILLFVAYQLWGTGIYTARAQDDLKDDLRDLIAQAAAATTAPTTAPPTTAAPTATAPGARASTSVAPTTTATTAPPTTVALPTPGEGDAMAIIEIPDIDVDWAVVEGVRRDDLKKGPGHYPTTPWPGQLGNAAIAGHRTTYGAPFNRLDELEVGDEIHVTDISGQFTYRVTQQLVVSPSDVEVLAPPEDPTVALLTLTTCHPKYSASERLIIQAELVGEPIGAPVAPAPAPTPPAPVGGEDDPVLGSTTTPASDPSATGPSASDPSATGPSPTGASPAGPTATTLSPADQQAADRQAAEENAAIQEDIAHFHAPGGGFYLWALVVAGVGAAWWFLFRRWKHWYTWVAGVPPFLFVLFFFYGQLESILPAGY
jgi:sortase A